MGKYSFVIFFTLLSFISCRNLLNQYASWDFLQNANFKIETPYKNSNEYLLPFTCDLTISNSAPLAIVESKVKKNNNEISFHLIFTLGDKGNINSINLGKINPGIYSLYYTDADKRKIFINEIIIQ